MSEAVFSKSSEVGSFLDNLFENQEGYVYCPTKNPATGYWQTYFFTWPEQRESITTHILDQSKSKDCYVAPSLFKAPSDKKQAWKGSNYVWVEFDGNAPSELPEGIPQPSIKIQSSTKGHEHWYWRLNSFETDKNVVSGLSKQLTYTLDADKSGWDASQVLRPPGTLHHESRRRVRLLSANPREHDIADFKNLVEPPEAVVIDTKFQDLPDAAEIVSKYKWDKDAYDLFKKQTQKTGSRSSAMTRLAHHCIEMGMTNEECYAILYNADERWGKFKNRPPADRAKRLLGIISHCRGKQAINSQLNLDSRDHFVSINDFLKRDIKVNWLYEGFLTERGFGIISSLPGVGKSSLSFRLGMDVILQKDFLQWKCSITKPKRVGFLSLEMDETECKQFINDILPSMTDEEKELVSTNFFLLDRGYTLNLWDKTNQQAIVDDIDNLEIDFLIIDSLKAAGGLDDKKAEQFYEWVNKDLRKNRKMTVWAIHHNRKPPNDANVSREPKDLSDLYGDMYIGAHATVVFSIHPQKGKKGRIKVIPMKLRLAPLPQPFVIERMVGTTYAITEGDLNLVDETKLPEKKEGESNGPGKSKF